MTVRCLTIYTQAKGVEPGARLSRIHHMADALTTSPQTSEHPHDTAHRVAELFGIAAAGSLLLAHSARVIAAVTAHDALAVLGALMFGAVLADIFSGVVHWGFDRFGDETTPLVGKAFVHPFRLHHTDPKDILRHGFLETNGNTSLATVVPLALLLLVPLDHVVGIVVVVTMATASVLAILTNQLHKWAHDSSPPAFVAFLQKHHVILPSDHHALHHAWPHETHYCITTGWMNAVLRKSFWQGCERVLERVGLHVHRG